MCFLETKVDFISNNFVRSLWGYPYVEWCYVPSIGESGGILVFWDRRAITKVEVALGNFVAACSFKNVDDGFVWAFTEVYGPNKDNIRHLLWEELVALMSWWDMLWCIVGISMSLIVLVKDRGELILGPP